MMDAFTQPRLDGGCFGKIISFGMAGWQAMLARVRWEFRACIRPDGLPGEDLSFDGSGMIS